MTHQLKRFIKTHHKQRVAEASVYFYYKKMND